MFNKMRRMLLGKRSEFQNSSFLLIIAFQRSVHGATSLNLQQTTKVVDRMRILTRELPAVSPYGVIACHAIGCTISPGNPPPYEEIFYGSLNAQPSGILNRRSSSDSLDAEVEEINQAIEDLDLLSNCKNETHSESPAESSNLEYWEPLNLHPSLEMGQTASMLSGKHRSKVSLTWVLRERDFRFNPCNSQILSDSSRARRSPTDSSHRRQERNKFFECNITNGGDDYFDKEQILPNNLNNRIVGRNAQQNKPLSAFDNDQKILKVNKTLSSNNYNQDSWSDFDKNTDYNNSTRKHKHRRRKKNFDKRQKKFGYEITDIDCFLAEASIENPGNIPVVVTYPSILYQTRSGNQQTELPLSLGMVVNAVFKNQQWLYVQTPHGEEGYILYASCLPLGIIPPQQRSSESWKTPCWESTWDLYPQPCGNMTDNEKEHFRGGTKSECGRSRTKHKSYADNMSVYSEKIFDKLYIRATSSCSKLKDLSCDNSSVLSYALTSKTINDFNLKNKLSLKNSNIINSNKRRLRNKENINSVGKVSYVSRHTLLVVEKDYQGSKAINTLSVSKGDVVILMEGCGKEADVDSEWYYIRNKDGEEGFIPASIAGHGYL